MLFPAKETYIPEAILADDVASQATETDVEDEKRSIQDEVNEVLA